MTLNGKLKKSRSGNFLNIYEVVRNILESNFTTTRPLFEKIIASQTTASLLQEKGVSKSFFEVKNSRKHFFSKVWNNTSYIDIYRYIYRAQKVVTATFYDVVHWCGKLQSYPSQGSLERRRAIGSCQPLCVYFWSNFVFMRNIILISHLQI